MNQNLKFVEHFIKRENEQGLQIGKTGVGRGYHLKNLGVKAYDPNQKCPHCNQSLINVKEMLVIPHGSDPKVHLICTNCGLNIEK